MPINILKIKNKKKYIPVHKFMSLNTVRVQNMTVNSPASSTHRRRAGSYRAARAVGLHVCRLVTFSI